MFGIDPRAAKVTWTAFLVGLAIFLAYTIRGTLLVSVFAVFFAYVVFPLVKFADRATLHRLSHPAVVAVVFIFLLMAVALFGVFIGNRIADEAAGLTTQLPQMLDPKSIAQRIPLPDFLQGQRERILTFIGTQMKVSAEQVGPFAQQLGKGLWHGVGGLMDVVLVPILGFFLIKDVEVIQKRTQVLLGRFKNRYWADVVSSLNTLLASYIRALALLSIFTFVSYGIALALLDVPYAALLAGVAAAVEAIPVVGPLSAAIAIVFVCVFSGYPHVLWVVAFVLVYRGFQDYALAPHLIGRHVQLSSLTVIVGLLAGEEIGGVVGMFLAVPVLAAARTVLMRREHRAEGMT